MDKYELKPCPFCGGTPRLKAGFPYKQRNGVKQALVQCPDCGCRTATSKQLSFEVWRDVKQNAVDAWNRRAEHD